MTTPTDVVVPTRRASFWRGANRAVFAICVLVAMTIGYGTYLKQSELSEFPLQVGDAVSVKNDGKGWRPGYVIHIAQDGEIHVAMGATRSIADRPQTDIVKLRGTARVRRRDTQGEPQ